MGKTRLDHWDRKRSAHQRPAPAATAGTRQGDRAASYASLAPEVRRQRRGVLRPTPGSTPSPAPAAVGRLLPPGHLHRHPRVLNYMGERRDGADLAQSWVTRSPDLPRRGAPCWPTPAALARPPRSSARGWCSSGCWPRRRARSEGAAGRKIEDALNTRRAPRSPSTLREPGSTTAAPPAELSPDEIGALWAGREWARAWGRRSGSQGYEHYWADRQPLRVTRPFYVYAYGVREPVGGGPDGRRRKDPAAFSPLSRSCCRPAA